MILTTAAFLTTVGLVAFVLGHSYGYQGIAVIGAILIVGVGAGAMVDGIETQTGERQIDVDNSTTEVERVYEPIGVSTSFPVGLVVLLLGGAMAGQALNPDGRFRR